MVFFPPIQVGSFAWMEKRNVLARVLEGRDALNEESFEMRDDVEVVKVALSANPDALQYASNRLQNMPEMQNFARYCQNERQNLGNR